MRFRKKNLLFYNNFDHIEAQDVFQPEPPCVSESTQGKRGNVSEFNHNPVLISGTLPRFPWVNCWMHASPDKHAIVMDDPFQKLQSSRGRGRDLWRLTQSGFLAVHPWIAQAELQRNRSIFCQGKPQLNGFPES